MKKLHLDTKIFILSCFMILGILTFPDNPSNYLVYDTYIIFTVISIAVSSFYMTYVRESKYNYFRKETSIKYQTKVFAIYIIICVVIAFIIASLNIITLL